MRFSYPPGRAIAPLTLAVQSQYPSSGQRILTEGRIAGGGFFTGGQFDVTLTSREHCSRLQQSRCHAVIED